MALAFDPVSEMNEMTRAVSRLLGESPSTDSAFYTIPVDLFETRDDIYVIAQLPGVRREDVKLEIVGTNLILRAERRLPDGTEGHFVHVETAYGRFERELALTASVQADRIEASWQSGMLIVHLPKADAVRPRTIPIAEGTAPGLPMLGGVTGARPSETATETPQKA